MDIYDFSMLAMVILLAIVVGLLIAPLWRSLSEETIRIPLNKYIWMQKEINDYWYSICDYDCMSERLADDYVCRAQCRLKIADERQPK